MDITRFLLQLLSTEMSIRYFHVAGYDQFVAGHYALHRENKQQILQNVSEAAPGMRLCFEPK
jgi:hypothetical protein